MTMAQKATRKKPSASKKPVASKKAVKAAPRSPAKKAAKAAKPAKPAAPHKATAHKTPTHKAPAKAPARKAAGGHKAAPKAPAHHAAHLPAHGPAKPAAPARPQAARSVGHGAGHAPAVPPPLTAPPAPPQVVQGALTADTPMRKPSRAAAKYAVPQAPIVLPPPTSRFADRFSPPRPPTRTMNDLDVDVPRQTYKPDPKLANAWKSKAGRELTEEEILAMPESEYMNDKQLEFFRYRLQQLKDDLLSNAGETTEHLREDTTIVPDPADRATIEEEHALELRTRDRERKLLKKISQSLARIDSGEYGFCDETGEPIGLGRLIARPTATLSLEAQQRRELKQKMFGD
jgi:DnaK suppressor protein